MADMRLERLAKLLVDYSVRVRPREQVLIRSQVAGLPLAQEVYRLVLQRGAHPFPHIEAPALHRIFLSTANEEQLDFISPAEQLLRERCDVMINIGAETNTRQLSSIDPARQARRQSARRPLMKTFMERSASGALRWTSCDFPTDAMAQEADMSLEEYEAFVYGACLCDQEDPAAGWEAARARQQQLVDWLAGKSEVHLTGPDTDLHVGIAGRPFVNCFGDSNMPDGEIFTGPEETRTYGNIRFSFPAIEDGREVDDVRLWFENGRVVKATAAKNEGYLLSMLATDDGARVLGEFAFGTNFGIQRFSKSILFDEKIGGTVHMALGAGYPESGSTNESGIHWDMICDLRQGGEVRVDGELFAKDGKYVVWG